MLSPMDIRNLNLTGACYRRSHFIGEQNSGEANFTYKRQLVDSDFERDLSGYAIPLSAISELNVDLDQVFASNVTAILAESYFTDIDDPSHYSIRLKYAGYSFMTYSMAPNNIYYDFFKDGKYKYSDEENTQISTLFLACVFPPSWTQVDSNGAQDLIDGIEINTLIEETDYERRAWTSLAYTISFRYLSAISCLSPCGMALHGLWKYHQFCSWHDMRYMYSMPILCLIATCLTSGSMAFVFLLDGWGSTGFLTAETQSVFFTCTMSSVLSTVFAMSYHWLKLRGMIASARRAGRLKDSNKSKTNETEVENQVLKRSWSLFRAKREHKLGFIMKILAIICAWVDCASFVYAKLLRRSVDEIRNPLLYTIAVLALFAGSSFMWQASGFARDIASLMSANNLNNQENLQYLQKMAFHMESCSFFLILAVVAAIFLAAAGAPMKTNVGAWIWLWQCWFMVRWGISTNIVRLSFLNVANRSKSTTRISPSKT